MSVTKEEMQAAIEAAVTAATKPLNDQIASLTAAPPPNPNNGAPPPEKIWTKAELRELIEKEQITEAQAEDVLERQREAKIRAAIREEVGLASANKSVSEQIDEFIALVPELTDKASKDAQRAKAQFENLVSRGMPKTRATELTALEMVYGTVDKLRAVKGARNEPESHMDAGGDGEPSGNDGRRSKIKYTADEKRYYGDLISKGIYKDWDAVDAEMAFANPRLREKHGARVH